MIACSFPPPFPFVWPFLFLTPSYLDLISSLQLSFLLPSASLSSPLCYTPGEGNPHHYFVASQDPELRGELRKRPGVPLLHIIRNTIVLEKPTVTSQHKAEEVGIRCNGVCDCAYLPSPPPPPPPPPPREPGHGYISKYSVRLCVAVTVSGAKTTHL